MWVVNTFRHLKIRKIFTVAEFYAAEFQKGCADGYIMIKNQSTCDLAATYLENQYSDFAGYPTTSKIHPEYVEGNKLTGGCHWQDGNLYLNPYGTEFPCKECRQLCVKQGMAIERSII